MDQTIGLSGMERGRAVGSLSQFMAAAIAAAPAGEAPFHHLVFDHIFPDDVYASMLTAMPVTDDTRPMSGRATRNEVADGTRTRVKIDLFPEYIRALPPEKRVIWDVVGRALCSEELKAALVMRLAPKLGRRFGTGFAKVGLYPVPILTRDIPGYRIPPHPDTHWQAITCQLYLPRDASQPHIGTILHEHLADGGLPKHTQLKFAPNTGYAFAVAEDTWHSADTLGPEVKTRDSILLTYFVDAGLLYYLRNRSRRVANFLLSEARSRLGR